MNLPLLLGSLLRKLKQFPVCTFFWTMRNPSSDGALLRSIIGEKFTYLGANVKLGFYTISHPLHPLQRVAAKERNLNVKAAASERKRQKVARAVNVEWRKRAVVREKRASRLQAAL